MIETKKKKSINENENTLNETQNTEQQREEQIAQNQYNNPYSGNAETDYGYQNKNNETSNSDNGKMGIYEKVGLIQSKIKTLSKTEKNTGQNYDFFNEKQVFDILKPLLEEYKLSIHVSDDPSQPFFFERNGNLIYVRYLKKIEIIDCEAQVYNVEEFNKQQSITFQTPFKLEYSIWFCGQNNDFAKAKGSAETYGLKYFLQKYFMIPSVDKSDPDFEPKTVILNQQQVKIPVGATVQSTQTNRAVASSQPQYQSRPQQTSQPTTQPFRKPIVSQPLQNAVSLQESRQLYKLYASITSKDYRGTKINSFFEFFNSKIAPKIGISEKVNPGNLARVLEKLDDANYQEVQSYLTNL